MKNHGLRGGAYVGNSVDDMRAAKGAGLIAVGVTTNQSAETLQAAGADYIIDKLAELGQLLLLEDA